MFISILSGTISSLSPVGHFNINNTMITGVCHLTSYCSYMLLNGIGVYEMNRCLKPLTKTVKMTIDVSNSECESNLQPYRFLKTSRATTTSALIS